LVIIIKLTNLVILLVTSYIVHHFYLLLTHQGIRFQEQCNQLYQIDYKLVT